jgi:hypothetical protein
MTINQCCGTGQQPGIHTHAFAGIYFYEDKAMPLPAVRDHFRPQPFEEAFLEFQYVFHIFPCDHGLGGSSRSLH